MCVTVISQPWSSLIFFNVDSRSPVVHGLGAASRIGDETRHQCLDGGTESNFLRVGTGVSAMFEILSMRIDPYRSHHHVSEGQRVVGLAFATVLSMGADEKRISDKIPAILPEPIESERFYPALRSRWSWAIQKRVVCSRNYVCIDGRFAHQPTTCLN